MYQIYNIEQFNKFIMPYIDKLVKLDSSQKENVLKNIKRIISNNEKYMFRINVKTIKTDYNKQLISKDTLREFKPNSELKQQLLKVIELLNEHYIELTKFNHLIHIINYLEKLKQHSAVELGNYGGYTVTRFDSNIALQRLLLNFKITDSTEDNYVLLFKKDNRTIMVYMDKTKEKILDILNYNNIDEAVDILNIVINEIVYDGLISKDLYLRLEVIIIDSTLMLISKFETLDKLEVVGDLIIDNPKIKSCPDKLKVGNNLIIKSCDELFEMNYICSVSNNLIINTTMGSLPKVLQIEGSIDLRNCNISIMPEKMYIEKDMLLINAKIKDMPKKLAVGGTLAMRGMEVSKMPEYLYIGEFLDLTGSKIKEIDDMHIKKNCSILESDIKRIGRNVQIEGTLIKSKNKPVSISHLAEINKIVEK